MMASPSSLLPPHWVKPSSDPRARDVLCAASPASRCSLYFNLEAASRRDDKHLKSKSRLKSPLRQSCLE